MNINFKFLNNLNLYKFLLNIPTGDFATEAKIVCNNCCISVSCTIYNLEGELFLADLSYIVALN